MNMLYPQLEQVVRSLDVETISSDRKEVLQAFIDYLRNKTDNNRSIRLNFICTHNSRRSHLSQIWAQTMACYFGIDRVTCYSGGTESTALFPMVAETLEKTGFEIKIIAKTDNPVYNIKYSENLPPIIGFSKLLDDEFNPKTEFAAIMTCSQADEGCPFVTGADGRIALSYEDPKLFDNTPQQADKYTERSLQIATEMYYVFSKVSA